MRSFSWMLALAGLVVGLPVACSSSRPSTANELAAARAPTSSRSSLPASSASSSMSAASTASSVPLPSVGLTAAKPAPGAGAATSVLPVPDFGPPGPIRAAGYPVPIRTAGNDPAMQAGFTRDSAEFGYCHTDGGLGATWCAFIDTNGKSRTFDTSEETKRGDSDKKSRSIDAWLKAQQVPSAVGRDMEATGPALTGVWPFARDIEIRVTSAEGTVDAGGKVVAQPRLRFGGRVAGHEAVFPFTLRTTDGVGTSSDFHGVLPNAIGLSPNGKEIGILAAWYGMEYANDFKMLRMSVNAFAAHVYNDTGFRFHSKGDFTNAQDLFLRATFADPTWERAPYNLACAYARGNDAVRAEAALKVAIERGGLPIAQRARADADFGAVRSADWFRALVPGPYGTNP